MPTKKPLSPIRAIKAEIRTLDRAQDKIIADAAIEDRRLIRRYQKEMRKIDLAGSLLTRSYNKKTQDISRNVDRELRTIKSRRARLEARLAAE